MSAPVNPHCERRWPYDDLAESLPGISGFAIAQSREALMGAAGLADLLHADDRIRADIDSADDPGEEPAPLGRNMTDKLFSALHVCLSVASYNLDRLPEAIKREKARALEEAQKGLARPAPAPAKAGRAKP